MALQVCANPGCGHYITKQDERTWKEAEERGISVPKGFCRTCIVDLFARQKIKRIRGGISQPADAPEEPKETWYESNEIKVGQAARILRLELSVLNGLISIGAIEGRTFQHQSRKVVEIESLRDFVKQVAKGTIDEDLYLRIPRLVIRTIIFNLPEIMADMEMFFPENGAED